MPNADDLSSSQMNLGLLKVDWQNVAEIQNFWEKSIR